MFPFFKGDSMRLLVLVCFCFWGSLAFSQDYIVQVQDFATTFQMSVQSSEEEASISRLVISNMAIYAPVTNKSGYIILKVRPDPAGYSLKQLGKSKGIFYFDKGRYLPQMPLGEYCLYINKEFYGRLFIEKAKVYLLSGTSA